MAKRPPLDPADIELFRQHMEDVDRLEHDRKDPHHTRPSPRPRQRELDESKVLAELMEHSAESLEVESGEELSYARPGLQHSVMRKLRRGQVPIEAELDLHGLTANVAREELAAFLIACRQRGWRCVRIIHGKGHGSKNRQPVLKNKVNNWLRQRDEVLAFCSARPFDGGTGAIYLLLRS